MIDATSLGGIPARVDALRNRYRTHDSRMAEVQAVRRGNIESIAPDLFSDAFRRPIVANTIDTAARDTAAVLAPLPAFNCSAASGLSDRAKAFADKRTKILRGYIQTSDFEVQMLTGADQYNSYGMLVLCIEPDFDELQGPRWTVEDAVGAYPVWDKRKRTVEMARVFFRDYFALEADYPQIAQARNQYPASVSNNKVEVVKYVSDKRVVMYLPQMGNLVLENIANPLGKCYYVAIQRPGLDDEIRGTYDDVIWVQLARHRLETLKMEAVDKAVRAPLVVTPDVSEVPMGPDAVITAQGGVNSIGRARLDIPNQAFAASDALRSEIQQGAMSPESRAGHMDASVITGRGVQELSAGWSSQIAAAQTAFKSGLRKAAQISFEMDEKLFGNVEKEIRGNDNGVPYALKYKPGRDIGGDHTVDITYGYAAGLDPNRALVFLLQSDGAGLLSKDYIRRNLPIDLNAVEEERKIAVEQSRAALIQSLQAMAQAIPQMAAQGADPTAAIKQQAAFIKALQGGKTPEEAALLALTPEPPPASAETPGAPTDGSAPGGQPQAPPPDVAAMMQGAGAPPDNGGRPPIQQMMAGLRGNGSPTLGATVNRQIPVGG